MANKEQHSLFVFVTCVIVCLVLHGSFLLKLNSATCFQPQFDMSMVVAGGGSPIGDGLQSTQAMLTSPVGVFEFNSEIYISDSTMHRIRKIDTKGVISTIAGTGVAGYSGDSGLATSAKINSPQGILVLSSGVVVFADSNNHCIRKIDGNKIYTVAGNGVAGYSNGNNNTQLNTPLGIANLVGSDVVYIADSKNHVVRSLQISSKQLTTFLGSGTQGSSSTGTPGLNFNLNTPKAVCVITPNLYVADSQNNRIVTTIGGAVGTVFAESLGANPIALAGYNSNLYVSLVGSKILKINSTSIVTMVGNGNVGYSGDGTKNLLQAMFNNPTGLSFNSSGTLFIADTQNARVRKISSLLISTIAGLDKRDFGNGVAGPNVSLSNPTNVYSSDGSVVFAERNNHVIRKLQNGIVYNVVGSVGVPGNSSNTVTVEDAVLNSPSYAYSKSSALNAITVFLDNYGCLLRRITTTGYVVNLAGSCDSSSGDTYFLSKSLVTVGSTIYLTDYFNMRIIKISLVDSSGSTFVGGSKGFLDGIGTAAKLNYPDSIAVMSDSILYFSDRDNHAIRSVVISTGKVTTIAGNQTAGFSGDGGPASLALLNQPSALAVNSLGEIIFIDKGNLKIRKISKYGNIFTIASGSYISSIVGLTLGLNGEIYLADESNNLIKKLYSPKCSNSTTYNSTTFSCDCPTPFYGETCLEFDCFGVNFKDSSVCNSRGSCLIPNFCSNCSYPYYGSNCEQYTCNGIDVFNSSVCSMNGRCSSPNNCTCDYGTFGTDCEFAYCNGLLYSNSSVCNSRGKCIGYNKCKCNNGYYGSDCEYYDCYGVRNNNASVCSGNGYCLNINNCSCLSGYSGSNCNSFNCDSGANSCLNNGTCSAGGVCKCTTEWGGTRCQYIKCYNQTSGDSGVCSAHGVCSSYDNCTCNNGWFGKECATTTCYGIMSNISQVCSSNGSCVGLDTCSCSSGYIGDECQYRVCYGLNHTDPNVCSSHGDCVSPNNCQCNNGYVGDQCQNHLVYLDLSKATVFSSFSPLLSLPASLGLESVLTCQDIFDSSELYKLGESDLLSCLWNSEKFEIMLGFNHLLQHGSTFQLALPFNVSIFISATNSLNSLSQKTFSSAINVLPTPIPSNQYLIVKSNNDGYYQNFKKVAKYWSCENCPQTLVNLLNTYENKSTALISSEFLNSVPLDSSNLKTLTLKYSTINSLQNTISSTDKTRIETKSKNMPPQFSWLGDNVKDAPFTCVGHNCIVEVALNSMNSSLSYTFSGLFNLLNSQFLQKQMFRLVNTYNGELLDSEYSSNFQIVGFQLKTYFSTPLSYYISYTTFDRLDYVLTNLNRTHSISDGKFTVSIYNEDPFISFTLSDYFSYSYECYKVNDNQIVSSNLCASLENSGSSLVIDPSSMGLGEGNYLVNLTLITTNSLTSIPYYYLGYFALQSSSNVPHLTVTQLPAVYPYGKSLVLKVIIGSNYPISIFKWKLTEGNVKDRAMVDYLLDSATFTSLSSNTFKSEITVPSSYLLDGEFIKFDISVGNQNGVSNASLSTRVDRVPRFSCEIFNLKNESSNTAFESLTSISCFNLPDEPISSFNMEFYSLSDVRINVFSNTLKKNVVTRIPVFGVDENIKVVVNLVNRYGSTGKISRIIPVSLPSNVYLSSNSIQSRFNYVIDQYNQLKSSEPLRIDTSNSINALLSILIQNETISNITSQLTSGLSSNQLANFNSILKDMISQLKSIQSLTYKVDEKIIPLVLPTISKIYKMLDILSIDESWVSDISTWLDWIYSGMSSAKQYYSPRVLSTILSNDHYNEIATIQEVLSNRYASKLEKQSLITSYRAQYLLLTGLSISSSSAVEIVDIASQYNGKLITSNINQDVQVLATFPLDFDNQISISESSQIFYSSSMISNDKTLNNILANRPVFDLSVYSTDGQSISVNDLKNPIKLTFTNLNTDYKANTNLTCVYYDSSAQTWSSSGISSRSSISKQEGGKIYFVMECNTTHLSLFSVQEYTFISAASSSSNRAADNTALTLGLALGISIPVVLIIIGVFVVVVIVLSVFVWKLKKTSKREEKTVDLDMSDFPSDSSMFLTSLVSISGNSSGSESFDPMSRYLDLVRIGQGAFGSVFKAMDSKMNKMKAIKVIRYQSNEELNGFMKEGTQLMNVNHPNILKVNDFFISQNNLLCIDMDFYEMGDLVQLTTENSVCSEKKLIQIMYQMLTALNYIHVSMKLIHRDIKPSNIFIKTINDEQIHVVIADFGLARADQGSAHKSYAGTPLFMSPELGYGGKYYFNTDIYSLGVTLYQIMTKDTQTSISQLLITMEKEDVKNHLKQKLQESNIYSNEVIELVISMLEKDFNSRPQSQDLLNSPLFSDMK